MKSRAGGPRRSASPVMAKPADVSNKLRWDTTSLEIAGLEVLDVTAEYLDVDGWGPDPIWEVSAAFASQAEEDLSGFEAVLTLFRESGAILASADSPLVPGGRMHPGTASVTLRASRLTKAKHARVHHAVVAIRRIGEQEPELLEPVPVDWALDGIRLGGLEPLSADARWIPSRPVLGGQAVRLTVKLLIRQAWQEDLEVLLIMEDGSLNSDYHWLHLIEADKQDGRRTLMGALEFDVSSRPAKLLIAPSRLARKDYLQATTLRVEGSTGLIVTDVLATSARRADDVHVALVRAAGVVRLPASVDAAEAVRLRAVAVTETGRAAGLQDLWLTVEDEDCSFWLTFEVMLPDRDEQIEAVELSLRK